MLARLEMYQGVVFSYIDLARCCPSSDQTFDAGLIHDYFAETGQLSILEHRQWTPGDPWKLLKTPL